MMGPRIRIAGSVGTLCVALALGTAACGGDEVDPAAEQQEAVDREMDMALEDREAEPELRDEAREDEAAEPPARQAPPPAPSPQAAPPPPPAAAPVETEPAAVPAPERRSFTAATGTTFRVELTEELNTRTNRVGDRFTVRILDPLTDGRYVVAPAETIIRGRVTALQKSGGGGQPAVIKVDFEDVMVAGEYYPIQATVIEANPDTRSRTSGGEKAAKIGGGAVAGAILGRVVGGDAKGAVIGAAVGAAAGTAITLITEDRDAVLPAGSVMTLELDAPLTVTVEG